MKKAFCVLAAVLTLVLCGCQDDKAAGDPEYGEDISKAQAISVISSDTSQVIDTIRSKEDIEDFIRRLDLEQWELKSLPSEAAEIGSFGLSQEETVRFGEDDKNGTLYDIASITLYSNSYIRFEITGFDMTFKVSKDTADYLNGYFE